MHRHQCLQPQHAGTLWPRVLIDLQLICLLAVSHQGVIQRQTGAARSPDGVVDGAGTQRQLEQFHQQLANARPRQVHALPRREDHRGQPRAQGKPFPKIDLLALPVGQRPPSLHAANLATGAARFKPRAAGDTKPKPDRAFDRRSNVHIVPSRVSLRDRIRR